MYIYIYICILCSIILSSHFPPKKNVLYHLPRVFFCGSRRGAQSKQTTKRSKTNHPFLDAFDIARGTRG